MVYACGLGKLGLIFTVYRKVFKFSFINLHHEKLEKQSVLLRERSDFSLNHAGFNDGTFGGIPN